MVKIKINGSDYNARADKNLLHTCLYLGFDIPYFCYHPALGSVGACRQCAVKKFAGPDDQKGKIIMSCMEPVAEGLIISTDDPEVKVFRKAVIESLMINHPHDCPVCDEGGECHLQDMTVMTGHNYRRFRFRKRTHHNQYLGPFIQHEMNRCIQCYRCVRFYRDYAGGNDLAVLGAADRVYFGRHIEGRLESEFSGNLIEVCPTGVFTDKTLREHYTRKWDLTNSPSVCVNCSIGCNIIVSERYGSVRRILDRYNGDVNGYFLCDRGRFGYEYINSPGRIRKFMARITDKGTLEEINDEIYSSLISSALKGKKIAGIGSPVASLEANFALEVLAGKENFYHGVTDLQYDLVKTAAGILLKTPAHSPSLRQIGRADAILILGEDLTENAPMLAMTVRQATRTRSFKIAEKSGIPVWNDSAVRELTQAIRSPLFIAFPRPTWLDSMAAGRYEAPAADIARFGFAIASAIDNTAPAQNNNSSSLTELVGRIAYTLMTADNPVIITGIQNASKGILHAASNIVTALYRQGRKPSLSIVFPECNSLGLGLMDGKSLNSLADVIRKGEIETLVILENDLYKRADKDMVNSLFSRCRNIIVLDYVINDIANRADLLVPSGTFAESTGTIVNTEGRAQRYYRVLPPDRYIKDGWRYISEMIYIQQPKNSVRWERFDDIVNALTAAYPLFAIVKEIMPDSEFRIFNEKIARQTLRFSGRTAMNSAEDVSEPGPPEDNDSALNFSMEGYKGIPSPYLVPYYWSPGWNSVQAMNKYLDEPSGTSSGGNPGVLLFQGKADINSDYYLPEE